MSKQPSLPTYSLRYLFNLRQAPQSNSSKGIGATTTNCYLQKEDKLVVHHYLRRIQCIQVALVLLKSTSLDSYNTQLQYNNIKSTYIA